MTDNGISCLLCGTTVTFGDDSRLLINSTKEISSKFATLVSRYLNLKFPIESSESFGDPVCCHFCLPAVTEFCDIYKRLECVQLELLRSAEGISKLLTSKSLSNYGFRNEFISSVEMKRRQHGPDLTSSSGTGDDYEEQFTEYIVPTMPSESLSDDHDHDHDNQTPEDEKPEVKHELLEECPNDEISDDGGGGDNSIEFPDDYFSIIEYNIVDKTEPEPEGAAIAAGINWRSPQPRQCIFCNKQFACTYHLVDHMRSHTEEKGLICRICLKEYATKCSIKRHIKLHHINVKEECSICGKQVADIHSHRRQKHSFSPKKSVCGICGKEFVKPQRLARHQLVHTEERKFECDICHFKFKYPEQVKNHKLKYHGEADQGKPFPCHSCGLDFEGKWLWLQHIRDEHKDKGKTSFKCPDPSCKFVVDKNHELKKHLDTHSQERERHFQCDQCGSAFSQLHSLNTHIKKMHSLTNPFNVKCKQCDQTFTDKGDLRNHEKTHVFDCDICGKIFKLQHNLRIHRKEVHLKKKKLFVCACGEKLQTQYQLKKHKKVVHGQGELYKCSDCQYSTYFKFKLARHISCCRYKDKHFQCKLCPSRFPRKSALQQHFKRKHAQENK